LSKIPAKTTARLLDSTAFMNAEYGVAWNGMVTLNFDQIGCRDEKAASMALTKLNEAIADRIDRHGKRYCPGAKLPHFFLYVQEYVETHGHHVHELIVLPPGLDAGFDKWLQGWATRNFENVETGATHYRGRYYRDDRARADQQRRLLSYVLKSSEDATIGAKAGGATTLREILGLDKYKRAYCAKVGKVAGCSQNLTHRARLKAGFGQPAWFEEALTDIHLREFHRRRHAEELAWTLRSIDV